MASSLWPARDAAQVVGEAAAGSSPAAGGPAGRCSARAHDRLGQALDRFGEVARQGEVAGADRAREVGAVALVEQVDVELGERGRHPVVHAVGRVEVVVDDQGGRLGVVADVGAVGPHVERLECGREPDRLEPGDDVVLHDRRRPRFRRLARQVAVGLREAAARGPDGPVELVEGGESPVRALVGPHGERLDVGLVDEALADVDQRADRHPGAVADPAAVPVEHRLGVGSGRCGARRTHPNTTASTTMRQPDGHHRRGALAAAVAHPGARGRPGRPPGAAGRRRARRRRRRRLPWCGGRPSPSRAANTTIADAGSTASTAEPSRKAAQSATHAATHTAMHAPSTKPGSAGAGATTSPNCVHASREVLAGERERGSVLGRPRKVVSR